MCTYKTRLMGERRLNLKFNRNGKCHKNENEEKSRCGMLVESGSG